MKQDNEGNGERTPAEKLIDHVRQRHGLIIAELSAEKAIGVCPSMVVVPIRGRDARSGMPREVLIGAEEIVRATAG